MFRIRQTPIRKVVRMLELDHLAITAETLREGCDWVCQSLGVGPEPGGKHTCLGTHNCVLGLNDGLYLEVIAVDPDAPAPARTRWFGLDQFQGPPRISNWICRTDDLEEMRAMLPGIGPQVALERDDFRWRMAVPENGLLPFDDCHAAVMQWDCDHHPAETMQPSGISLRRLIITHPEAQELERRLYERLADRRIVFETGRAALRAEFETSQGTRFLG